MGNTFNFSNAVLFIVLFSLRTFATSDCIMLCSNQADQSDIEPSQRPAYIGSCTSSCKSNSKQYNFLKEKYSMPTPTENSEHEDLPKLMGGGIGIETSTSADTDPYDKKLSYQGQSPQISEGVSLAQDQPETVNLGSAPAQNATNIGDPNRIPLEEMTPAQRCAICHKIDNCDEVCPKEYTQNSTQPTQESPVVNQAALCEQAHTTAMNDCDTERQSWMKNIQMAAQGIGPIMESGACGKLAAANVGASTSLATFKVMCNTAAQACLTECRKPNSNSAELATMATRVRECNAKGTKAAEAEQAAAQGTQQLLAAVATCKNTFGVNANPFDIRNDPYKGQTAEEIMAGLQPAGGAPLEYSGAQGSSAGTGNSNFDLSGLEQDEEIGKPRAAAKSAAGAPGGSMGSAGMGGGGGSSVDGGGGGSGGKRPTGGLLSNILSGFFGGGGGGSSLFGGTGRGKGGLSSFFGGEKPQEAKTPDLRQFMPGGKLDPRKARGLAGQRLNADGMSGPHGNIWRMINNRYQYKKASLLP